MLVVACMWILTYESSEGVSLYTIVLLFHPLPSVVVVCREKIQLQNLACFKKHIMFYTNMFTKFTVDNCTMVSLKVMFSYVQCVILNGQNSDLSTSRHYKHFKSTTFFTYIHLSYKLPIAVLPKKVGKVMYKLVPSN